ncbi:MAG: cysteine desulfurase family protein [Cardiobacteriaceae bacterium]|nr:cysteine desulfurase family protein [Cardiobacteriaceae bacterium]
MNPDWAYFDYAATTPVADAALRAFAEALAFPGNSGATHGPGLRARAMLEDARERFAACVGADSREIVFTSGATEANNLALKGTFAYHGVKNPRLVTVQTEHKAVLDPAGILVKSGVDAVFLPVRADGLLDLAVFEEALAAKPPTLVSVMAVNNETGVVQPLRAIADLVHRYGGKFHVDAAQALGKIAVDVRAWDADMVSFSGHKVYAPQGIGALFVRRLPKMRLQALLHGGGQERGRRSGTSPLALVCAFAAALEEATHALPARIATVQAHFDALHAALPGTMTINGALEKACRVPHIVNVATGRDVADVLARADAARIALSAGSACQSGEASHVLQAMGRERSGGIRVSLSHLTTPAEMARLTTFFNTLENP